MLNEQNALEWMDRAAASARAGISHCKGRGVVIAGGGLAYFPCVWVSVNRLREVGCTLPIELWHLENEVTPQMRNLLKPLDVTCIDATDVQLLHGTRRLGGWELKAYALLHSGFREALLLDADNFPVVDPTFLFDSPEYRRFGAIFWPDHARLQADRLIWKLVGVDFRDEMEFESGQIIVDRERCRAPLELSMWMNEHSDFWYRHFYGDKETFHLAWRKLGFDYAMPPYPTLPLEGVMCQHDFQGRRIFQHRVRRKWRLIGVNPETSGFAGEASGMSAIAALRRLWTERWPSYYDESRATPAQRQAAAELCAGRWNYHRISFDSRPVVLCIDGTVGEGAAMHEVTWNVQETASGLELLFWGDRGGRTCVLTADAERKQWRGKWEICEQMAIELSSVE